jgi:hypothetical protein
MSSVALERRNEAAVAVEATGVVENVPRSEEGLLAAEASSGLLTGSWVAVAMRVTE